MFYPQGYVVVCHAYHIIRYRGCGRACFLLNASSHSSRVLIRRYIITYKLNSLSSGYKVGFSLKRKLVVGKVCCYGYRQREDSVGCRGPVPMILRSFRACILTVFLCVRMSWGLERQARVRAKKLRDGIVSCPTLPVQYIPPHYSRLFFHY